MNHLEKKEIDSHMIKAEAKRLGFTDCGISTAEYLAGDADRLKTWLDKGMHGTMDWMERNFEKRTDPRLLLEGTMSVISVILNYYPEEQQKDPEAPVVAKYAYGEDYHFVMKDMLNDLLEFIRRHIGEVQGRAFVDSAPVLDRAWAKRAGLGWIGKNTNLISQEHGSFIFIGQLMVDIELEPDNKLVPDLCGTCTLCIETCPTGAITEPYVVDGSKCISYFTIENKGDMPAGLEDHFKNRVFGCDICQDICPWNWKKAKPHNVERLKPLTGLLEMSRDDWHNLTLEEFSQKFKKSPLKRPKYDGLRRNLAFIRKQEEK
jgi:epoxyqueuosine reductase